MQNAKDSFYMALRTRLAAINPERTILLRGAARPGILVEEAEAPPPERGPSDRERIAALEQEVAELKRAFEDFRRNFE